MRNRHWLSSTASSRPRCGARSSGGAGRGSARGALPGASSASAGRHRSGIWSRCRSAGSWPARPDGGGFRCPAHGRGPVVVAARDRRTLRTPSRRCRCGEPKDAPIIIPEPTVSDPTKPAREPAPGPAAAPPPASALVHVPAPAQALADPCEASRLARPEAFAEAAATRPSGREIRDRKRAVPTSSREPRDRVRSWLRRRCGPAFCV